MPCPQLISGDRPPRRHYRENFLQQVVVRADFDNPLPLKNGPPRPFIDAVRESFPINEPVKTLARELMIGPDSLDQKTRESVEWIYWSRDRTSHVNLGSDALVVATTRYDRFEPFLSEFQKLFDAVLSPFPDRHVTRLGLRYINHVPSPTADPINWNEYFIPSLHGIFDLAADKKTISRAFHVIEFHYDGVDLRFQFGLHNVDHPAPIRRGTYVLDYDVRTNFLLERHEVPDYLRQFHNKVNASFEEVITDSLRAKMGVLDE